MSIEDTKAKIAVMQAAVDGKDIEYRVSGESNWHLLDGGPGTALWNWTKCEYRVAPREVWVIFNNVGQQDFCTLNEDTAKAGAEVVNGTYAKFVEVLE